MKKLVVINGAPGSGKTTVVDYLRKQLDITIIEKDAIKEYFFDYVGIGDREWSQALGRVAIDTLFALADQLFTIKDALIIETAFYASPARRDIARLASHHDLEVLELYCRVDETLRRERFAERARTNRHPGHADLSSSTEETTNLDRYMPLKLGEVIDIDTSGAVDMDRIKRTIETFCSEGEK